MVIEWKCAARKWAARSLLLFFKTPVPAERATRNQGLYFGGGLGVVLLRSKRPKPQTMVNGDAFGSMMFVRF